MTPISSREFAEALVKARVLTQDEVNRTRRIVIDCGTAPRDAVRIYREEYGDAGALKKLAPMLGDLLRESEGADG